MWNGANPSLVSIFMNTKAKGEISEAIILSKLISAGYPTSIPFGNNQRYDFVIEKDNSFLRIQCKTATKRKGTLVFKACSTNGFTGKNKSYRGEADIFLVYSPSEEKVYWVPVNEVGKNCVTLRLKEPKNKAPKSTIRFAKDYEFILGNPNSCIEP